MGAEPRHSSTNESGPRCLQAVPQPQPLLPPPQLGAGARGPEWVRADLPVLPTVHPAHRPRLCPLQRHWIFLCPHDGHDLLQLEDLQGGIQDHAGHQEGIHQGEKW